MNNTITLRRNDYENFKGWQLWLQFGIIAIVLITTSAPLFFSKNDPEIPAMFLFMPIVYAIFLFFYQRFVNEAKIDIDEFGLTHKSGLPDFLQQFYPDWKISWAEIQKVNQAPSTLSSKSHVLLPLRLSLLNKSIKLQPLHWVNPKEKKPKRSFFQVQHNYISVYENSPLIKVFVEKGLLTSFKSQATRNKEIESDWTDIKTSPIAVLLSGLIISSILYFIMEIGGFMHEIYIENPPYEYNAIVAIMAAGLTYLILIKSKLKNTEKIIFAVLLGLSAALITYPLLLRINQWTDSEDLQSYTYTLLENKTWEANQSSLMLPKLHFARKNRTYWRQFEAGTTKEFKIRQGGLGFYQLNMEQIIQDQHTFYKDRY